MSQFLTIVKEYLKDKKWATILLGGIIGLFGLFTTYILNEFDLEAMESLMAMFPEDLFDFFGGLVAMTNPYGFLTLEVLGFIWLYAGIYLVFSASSLLSQEIEEKTIELSLSKPITRTKFLGSKIVSLYMFITIMMALAFLILSGGIATSQMFIDEGLYWDRVWGTYVIVVLFLSALSMIAFFGSTIFLNSKKAMVIGIIALFSMFFIDGFYSYMEAIENLKYFTVFFYYNPIDYLVHADIDLYIRDIIVLTSINAALVIGSLIVFNKKDIPN
ncbi:hypothetical protein ES708_22684 [subsurface metagenome]